MQKKYLMVFCVLTAWTIDYIKKSDLFSVEVGIENYIIWFKNNLDYSFIQIFGRSSVAASSCCYIYLLWNKACFSSTVSFLPSWPEAPLACDASGQHYCSILVFSGCDWMVYYSQSRLKTEFSNDVSYQVTLHEPLTSI